MEVESHEKHENHFVSAFKPQFSPMYVLAHLNSYFKPIDCFFAVFFDEIEDILIGYISVNRSKDSKFWSWTPGNTAYKTVSIIGGSSLETPLGERLLFYFPQLP